MSVPIPTADNIVIVEDSPEETTASGLHLPQTRRDVKLHTGTVVAVGPGKQYADLSRARMDVVVGDKVIFSNLSGVGITYDDMHFLIMSHQAPLAILEEGDDN